MKGHMKVHSDPWSINIQSVYTGDISPLFLIFSHEQITDEMKLFSVFCAVLASAVAGPPSPGSVSVRYGSDVRQETPAISYGPPASPPIMSYQPPPPPRTPPAPVAYYSPPPVVRLAVPPPVYSPPPVVRSTVPPPVYSSYSSPPANPPVSYAPPAPASPPLPPISVLITAPANPPASYYSPPPASPPVPAYGPPALPPASPPVQSYAPPATPVRIPPPVQSYAPPPATPIRAPAPAYGGYASAPADSYGGQRLSSDISGPSRHIPITSFQQEIREGAHHQTSFQTGHGIQHQETTQIRQNPNARGLPEDESHGKALIQKSGQVSYQSPEGQTINLRYVADEHGFRPEGSHLPTPPPIPADIQASLRLLPKLEEPFVPIISQPPGSPAAPGGGGGGYGSYSSPPSNPPVMNRY